MELIASDDPRLLQVSEPFKKDEINTPETRELAKNLRKVMVDNMGFGIAAVQCGVLKQMLIIKTSDFSDTMINPVILSRSGTCEFQEGCLSFKNTFINVVRAKSVKVKYIDLNGKSKFVELKGLPARVFLHEYEHLEGIVFTVHAKN